MLAARVCVAEKPKTRWKTRERERECEFVFFFLIVRARRAATADSFNIIASQTGTDCAKRTRQTDRILFWFFMIFFSVFYDFYDDNDNSKNFLVRGNKVKIEEKLVLVLWFTILGKCANFYSIGDWWNEILRVKKKKKEEDSDVKNF